MVAAATREITIPARRRLSDDELREAVNCARSFRHFARHWKFRNRDTGDICSLADLWPGQQQFADLADRAPWIIALKAGKLGFSELECCFDAWRALFTRNARVHLFSMGQAPSIELMRWVKFGLDHLPDWMRLPVLYDEAGGNNATSIRMNAGPDDVRMIVSYPSSDNISIDQVATHTHVDEFARIPRIDTMWRAIESTVSPENGTCHIVSRGAGPSGPLPPMWRSALAGDSKFRALFVPWTGRPRPKGWFEKEAKSGLVYIRQFAPSTWQEALQGDSSYVYPMFENPAGRHVISYDPVPLHLCEKVAVGVDPGGGHPTALVLLGERTSGAIHQYDEWQMQYVGAREIAEKILEWEELLNAGAPEPPDLISLQARAGPFEIVPPQSPATRQIRIAVPNDEPTLLATLQDWGFAAVEANREKEAGIQLVTERLNTEDADGAVVGYLGDQPVKVSRFTIHQRCKDTIEQFADYRRVAEREAETRVVYTGDRTIKHHADLIDGLRYAALLLAQWVELRQQRLRSGRIVWVYA